METPPKALAPRPEGDKENAEAKDRRGTRTACAPALNEEGCSVDLK